MTLSPFDEGYVAPEPKPVAEKVAPERPRTSRPAAEPNDDGDEDAGDDSAERLAAIQAQADAIVDGVYFGLPDAVYHAVPRLSASGLQKLCISPGTFWASSWLNPNRPVADEDQTKAQILGRAYHVARLEPELFDAQYVRALEKADAPKGTLFTGTEMGKALEECGEKKSGSVAEQAARLIDAGYPGPIWQIMLAEWESERAGRIAIPGEFYDQIIDDMESIRGNGEIAELLTGGHAEVSIFWTDEHGLKMKARADYLTAALWDDFKTFANPNGKELERAVADAIRYNRYHVQAVTYRDAVEAIRLGGLQIIGDATDAQRATIAAIQMRPGELQCFYIFNEKGNIPNLLAVEFDFFHVPINTRAHNAIADDEGVERQEAATRTRTELHVRGRMDIERAKRAFVLHCQVYEPGQKWYPIKQRISSQDLSFNTYWLEGKD